MYSHEDLVDENFPKEGIVRPAHTGSDHIYGTPESGYDLSKSYYTPGRPTKYREDSIINNDSSFDKKVRS